MCDDYVGQRTGPRSRPAPRTSAGHRPGCLECTARGHHDAFEDLYDATVEQVWRLARLKGRGDEAWARQVVRETYAEVWRSASTFRAAEHRPLTWVLAVASSVARTGPRRDPGPWGGRVA
jgi:DNA-directed RNA polymerase specialized sigma24 family protein